jgi:ABC-type microcin C transport system permease subunit YejB
VEQLARQLAGALESDRTVLMSEDVLDVMQKVWVNTELDGTQRSISWKHTFRNHLLLRKKTEPKKNGCGIQI